MNTYEFAFSNDFDTDDFAELEEEFSCEVNFKELDDVNIAIVKYEFANDRSDIIDFIADKGWSI